MAENEISYKINIIGNPFTHITELINQSTTLTSILDVDDQSKYNTAIQVIKEHEKVFKLHFTYWRTLQVQKEADLQDKQELYNNGNGVMLVYDYGNRKSFDDLQDWIDEQKQYTQSNTIVILLGIKADDAEFSYQMVKELAEELNLKQLYETSISNPEILMKFGKTFIKHIFQKHQYPLLKICVIGDNSDLNYKFGNLTAEYKFKTNYMSTIGHDTPSKMVISNNTLVKLMITVLASGQHFTQIRKGQLSRGTLGCLILFDKGNLTSFKNISNWYDEIKQAIPNWPIPIAMVGIITEKEEITYEEGQELANQLNIDYYETEVTENRNVSQILQDLTKKILVNISY